MAMGAPLFLIKPTQTQLEGVPYEPFPADGEPKYTTHPAFRYDGGLRIALDSFLLYVNVAVMKMKMNDPTATMEGKLVADRAWLAGDTPIPDIHWDSMNITRAKWLTKHGYPLDSPVGFLHPETSQTNSRRW